jgi:hypothetical protein
MEAKMALLEQLQNLTLGGKFKDMSPLAYKSGTAVTTRRQYENS